MRKAKRAGARAEEPQSGIREIAYDEKTFFESFYRANVKGDPTDCMTIGGVYEPESRFHYNATENSIIRAMLAISPLPDAGMLDAWTMLRRRNQDRLLDIGSGTGHWIDFMREVFFIRSATAIEITEKMAAHLRSKYADDDNIHVLQTDITGPEFDVYAAKGPFDYVTAIGVMFHLVDDSKWDQAVANISAALKPKGLFIVGDDFGVTSRNVQFHGSDEFSTWREFKNAEKTTTEEIRVNKRTRSLADWQAAAARHNLSFVTLVRTDSDPRITTPENDILVLRRTAE